ncbi:hypothetical protein G6F57_014790 [Rhizopus arrhizus]|nr:hypothetical protein G6F23_012362 [Rhizopus arrhizus]KAG0752862.1 hypothetical protein G6F24_013331 [Rhizopus arrhizus]KAG0780309.1 hypothetical protein G6F22_010156 [Rhizopus arrhizus]KAG0784635.1 hypothetical protein G6F21_009778 [Rhizopus arrhizus]KAG0807486.1 hypothetical protein G6F20_010325 [Rhizopus arrhizus]
MSVPKLETVAITLFKNGVAEIAFNRPKRYNALSPQSYKDWLHALKWAADTNDVKVAVLTGRGKFYTSGQELVLPDPDKKEMQRAVNGPSIGFGTTTLALCDVTYAVPEATFTTPFMKLGFCAEGCSSLLFPRIMGPSKANEMLLLGRTFTAQEMVDCGLISRLIESDGFRDKVLAIADQAAQFSVSAVRTTKRLIRGIDVELLEKVNREEMHALGERMESAESIESIRQFIEAGKKKKAKL